MKQKQEQFRVREESILKLLKYAAGIILIPYLFFNMLYYVSLSFVSYFVFIYVLYMTVLFALFIKTQYVLRYFRGYEYEKKRIYQGVFILFLLLSLFYQIHRLHNLSDPFDLHEAQSECLNNKPSFIEFCWEMIWHFSDTRIAFVMISLMIIKGREDML